jgi:hypothetical protein
MINIECFILSYEITKGMKSYGPIGLLKATNSSKELILCQIECLNKIFHKPSINIISGFGNEKLYKKLSKNIGKIYNDKFETANHGYAMQLILSNFDETKYDGLFIMDHGVLLKDVEIAPASSFKSSWVLNRKIKKNDVKNKYIGSVIDSDGAVDYIFYDVGPFAWCNVVYLSKNDIVQFKKNINLFYENMFLFEIINKSVSSKIVKYKNIVIPNDSFITITGLKDKNKIKELI